MTDTFDVDVTRDLDGPVDRAWAAWATPEGLRAWWGPGPFTCPAAEVDLRVGGRALVAMRAPAEYGGGGDQWSTWDFSLVEPARRIEYTFRFSDADGAPQDPPMPGVPAEGRHRSPTSAAGAAGSTWSSTATRPPRPGTCRGRAWRHASTRWARTWRAGRADRLPRHGAGRRRGTARAYGQGTSRNSSGSASGKR
ncbi:hypothetical protein GCM10010413_38330 [Promicromonospora sukumoe]